MGHLLAIDPGDQRSALLLYNVAEQQPIHWMILPNDEALRAINTSCVGALAIEMIASYGMPVGREVFETCVWIGRFVERWHGPEPRMVYRRDVKLHLCGSARAKDANVRQALIDKFGPGKALAIGRKATPGPLYGLTGDCWAALGVAVAAAETFTYQQEAVNE